MNQGPRRRCRGPACARRVSLPAAGFVDSFSCYFRFDARLVLRFVLRFDRPPVFLRPPVRFRPRLDFRFAGTFAPSFRASDSPIAIACFLLVTRPPLPPGPRRNDPLLRFFIARSTRFPAFFPYLLLLFFRVAMSAHPRSRWWCGCTPDVRLHTQSKGCAS